MTKIGIICVFMQNLVKSNEFFPPSLNPKTGRVKTRSQPRCKGLVRMQVEYQQPPLKLTDRYNPANYPDNGPVALLPYGDFYGLNFKY